MHAQATESRNSILHSEQPLQDQELDSKIQERNSCNSFRILEIISTVVIVGQGKSLEMLSNCFRRILDIERSQHMYIPS